MALYFIYVPGAGGGGGEVGDSSELCSSKINVKLWWRLHISGLVYISLQFFRKLRIFWCSKMWLSSVSKAHSYTSIYVKQVLEFFCYFAKLYFTFISKGAITTNKVKHKFLKKIRLHWSLKSVVFMTFLGNFSPYSSLLFFLNRQKQ
jgi:hypothetical protein